MDYLYLRFYSQRERKREIVRNPHYSKCLFFKQRWLYKYSTNESERGIIIANLAGINWNRLIVNKTERKNY